MARAADQAANDANKQYTDYSKSSLNNANADAAAGNSDISSLEGNDPYTSKSFITNQNLLSSGAANATNTAAAQQMNDAALRTGTNTAALGRTISSNQREGQRTMDQYNAQTAVNNTDKSTALKMGLIQDRNAAAATQAGLYSTSAGGQGTAEGNLTTLQGQNDQMWGNIIGGVASGAGAAMTGGFGAGGKL